MLFWVSAFCAGCPALKVRLADTASRPASGSMQGLSLIEIGERAMETGERLEEQGLTRGALESYRRAAWAFEYHRSLTGVAPLLLEDAHESAARVHRKLNLPKNPK